MDSTDNLIGGFASGDGAAPPAMKREQDSTDDFEHLERDGKRAEAEESPVHKHDAARHATQSFLDMERDEFVDTPRAPSVTDKLDHIADKFTDSESDADTAGESPLHRPEPFKAASLEPTAPLAHDSTPTLAPTPAPAPSAPVPVPDQKPEQKAEAPVQSKPEPELPKPAVAVPKPEPEQKKPEPAQPQPEPVQPKPEPAREPVQPKVEPVLPKQEAPKPAPVPAAAELTPEPPRAPTAHVIEAEVIFCQMGLDAWFDPQRLHPEGE